MKRKYNELQSQKSAFEEVYEVLQTRSEREAEEVYRRIRRGADAGSILRHVNYGDVLVQLALVPEARYRYEFPYLPDMPPFLRRPDNPYLDSEVYACALRDPPDHGRRPPQILPDMRNDSSPTAGTELRDPYLKPYSSAAIVHPWLDSVKPSRWTNVSTDDSLMRKLLHDYLLYDYDWFSFFHKDYFLEDMATENQRFCSRLLVNAVLCIGSVSFRSILSGQLPLTDSQSSAIAASGGVRSLGILRAWGTSFLPKQNVYSRLNRNSRRRSGHPETRIGSTRLPNGSSGGSQPYKRRCFSHLPTTSTAPIR